MQKNRLCERMHEDGDISMKCEMQKNRKKMFLFPGRGNKVVEVDKQI